MNLDATFSVSYSHRLRCTRDVFDLANTTLIDLLGDTEGFSARAAAFVDAGVAEANPAFVRNLEAYFAHHENRIKLVGDPVVLPGGEEVKKDRTYLDKTLQAISDARLCRQSYVIVIGGGAVLDTVGLASTLAHRGVRLIRIATTTLSQADSALGVKNGINAFGQKNYLGAFDMPWAIIHDEALLSSLSDRDWRSGFSEAVKVALLKDGKLFSEIERDAAAIGARDESVAIPIIRASAKHHFDHITLTGDPFERGSGRPLDFGHWAAHRLELLSNYELRHGEAVAIGLAIDVTYAQLQNWIAKEEVERILTTMERMGFDLHHPAMDEPTAIIQGLADFREHLGGRLSIPMIRAAGDTFDAQEIDEAVMLKAIAQLCERSAAMTQAERSF
jgi:3-dehydroquinate synthase